MSSIPIIVMLYMLFCVAPKARSLLLVSVPLRSCNIGSKLSIYLCLLDLLLTLTNLP